MSDESLERASRRPTTKQLHRLRQLLEHHDGNRAKTGEAIGYSDSAVADFLAKGEMPVTADLACEALLRRLGASLRPTEPLVVRGKQEYAALLGMLAIALGGAVSDRLVGVVDGKEEFFGVVMLAPDRATLFSSVAVALGGSAKKAGTTA